MAADRRLQAVAQLVGGGMEQHWRGGLIAHGDHGEEGSVHSARYTASWVIVHATWFRDVAVTRSCCSPWATADR